MNLIVVEPLALAVPSIPGFRSRTRHRTVGMMAYGWLVLSVFTIAIALMIKSRKSGVESDMILEGRMTLAIVKPNAFERRLEILEVITNQGLILHRSKEMALTKNQVETFYEEHQRRPFFSDLTEFMSSGKVLVALFKGEDAVGRVRLALGPTDPFEARKLARVGSQATIRAIYGIDVTRNAAHASDSPASALREATLLFPELIQKESMT